MTFRRVLLLVCVPLIAFTQEFRATINGRITDPSGTPVSGAKVLVKNLQTNEGQTATTSMEGDYTVPFLKPGNYSVTAEATGFKTALKENLQLFVNDRVTLNFALELGAVQETVTVSAEAPLLESATASRGGVIENMRVTELPLSGRNPLTLANLTTGVQFSGNPQFTRPFDNGDNVRFSINGGLQQTNSYLLDGTPDDAVTDADTARTRSQQNIAYIPTVDATQEFKIVTNFYDSQYGRTGGGIVNITTKSGTNEFHGTVYEFMRRYQLDANSIQNNAQGRQRYGIDPITKENLGGHKLDQYGTNLTGPVFLPRIYNGKDRTFFQFGFENYIESTPSPILTSVPSAAERTGDFSKSGITVWDPLSTRENLNFNQALPDSATNPRYIRTQFPNNIIPADRLSPIGLNIAKNYPAPNVGDPNQRFNNFITSPNLSEDHFRSYIARVDQNFGQKERMFFRYAHNRRNQIDNGANGYTGLGRDAQDPLVRINDNAVVDSVTVLSPTTILDLRAGYTRFVQAAYRQSVMPFDATVLGFPASFSASRFTSIPPRIEVEQYPTWGSRNPNSNITNLLSGNGSLSRIMGKHSVRIGGEYRDFRANVLGGSFLWGGGDFQFNRAFTQQFPAFSDSSSGSALASLLLGAPSGGVIQNTPVLAYRWPYYGLYVQDDIKLTARLSVNLGLRWDVEGSPTERYNRMNRGFAFGQPGTLAAAVKNANAADCPACANLTGGLLFVGNSGSDRAAFDTEHDHFQPRVGAAYQIASRTVLRGGYGMFYLPEAAYGGSIGYSVDTPVIATIGGGANSYIPATLLGNPFPNGLLQPTGNSLGLGTYLGNQIQFQNPSRQIPHVHQFSFGVQHQLPWEVRVDASYVGSRTVNINTGDNFAGSPRNLNVNTPEQLARARQDSNFFNQAVPNPFAGLLPNNPTLNAPTIRRQQLLLPYPQFTNVLMGSESVGKLWYDSLQLNVEKRYRQGLVFVLAWTWSKNIEAVDFINPQDPAPTKNLTANDRTHRVVFSGVWQLPVGRNRHFLHNAGRPVEMILGGWEYNWIGNFGSGVPVGLPGNVDLIGNPAVSGQNFGQWFNTCVLQLNGTAQMPNAGRNGFTNCTNPAWAIRGPNTLRSIPFRSGQLRQPWRSQWDMSLNKRFNFTEKCNFQFRVEAFNALNTPILGGVNTNPTDPNFGFVAPNQSNFPRNIQLGFKFNW